MAKGKKTGGRTAGTPNKITTENKEKISWVLNGYSKEQMKKDFDSLQSIERLKMAALLYEFVIPKLQRSEVQQSGEITVNQSMIIGGQKIVF